MIQPGACTSPEPEHSGYLTPQKNQVGGLCCQLIHFSTPTEFVPRRDLVNKLLKQLGDQKKFMQELKAEHAGASAEQLEQSLDQPRCPSHSIQIQAETPWNNAEYAQLLLGTL